jgi:hypothetical protein
MPQYYSPIWRVVRLQGSPRCLCAPVPRALREKEPAAQYAGHTCLRVFPVHPCLSLLAPKRLGGGIGAQEEYRLRLQRQAILQAERVERVTGMGLALSSSDY